jgi:hypothetical protein
MRGHRCQQHVDSCAGACIFIPVELEPVIMCIFVCPCGRMHVDPFSDDIFPRLQVHHWFQSPHSNLQQQQCYYLLEMPGKLNLFLDFDLYIKLSSSISSAFHE